MAVHIVVVGCGRVGSGLARELEAEGHSISVVDRQKRSFRRLGPDFSGIAVEGSGFDRDVLATAGIERAGAVAAVTSGDNSNILCARIAREHFGVERVVARIYDPRRAEVYQRLGIATVATVTWTIEQVRRWLLPDELRTSWTDATGQLLLLDRPLPEHLAGKRLSEIEVPGKLSLIGVTRGGQPRLDAVTMVGQDGDMLHVAVLKSEVELLDAQLSSTSEAHR